MSLTAAQICSIARTRASAPGFTIQSGMYLNNALEEIVLTGDYEVTRTPFYFSLTIAQAPIINPQWSPMSGPITLPPDWVRTKKADVVYYPLVNYPFQLTPIDLEEFDHQVQQAGLQTFPVYFVVDITQRRNFKTTYTQNVTAGNGTFSVGDATGIAVGQGVFGDPIRVGSVTLVTNIVGATVTVSPAANVIATYAAPRAATVMFASCPNAYVWPPTSGSYPAFARYFRKMADLVSPESSTQVPWFEYTDLLIDAVTARLMKDTGDPRGPQIQQEVRAELARYVQMKDDMGNRAHRVTLDRRRFGAGFHQLPRSKILGWVWAGLALLPVGVWHVLGC